jgi:surface antigen/archaellum component FlaC
MQEQKVNTAHLVASYLSAFSMLALAGALVYFTIELVYIARQIPDILQTVEQTSEKIGPVITEVGEIKDLVPPILHEIEETRKLVRPVLDEYAKTNQQIPRILDEVEATRKTLPDVLKTVNNASSAVVTLSKEVEATRPLIPEVLTQVEKTREFIPPMLDRADQLVANARTAGKEASQGAVTGVFSGILLAPFAFVGDVGKSLVGASDKDADKLSKEDYAQVESASRELLELGKKGDVKNWNNEDNDSSGTVKLIDITDSGDDAAECRELQIVIKKNGNTLQDKKRTLCKGADGKWDFK